MSVTVRTLDPNSDELSDWLACVRRVFKEIRPLTESEVAHRRRRYNGDRLRAAWDDGQVVASTRSFDTALSVPGGELPANAVTGVTVLPTHRRRGLMSELITRDLAGAAEREVAVAVLIASEAPIYGRFGFGPSTECVDWTVDLRTARFRAPAQAHPRLRLRLVEPEQLVQQAPAVYQASRHPGDIDRNAAWWDGQLGLTSSTDADPGPQTCVLAEDGDSRARGYLRYRVRNEWVDRVCRTEVHVTDLRAVDPDSYAQLWRYLVELDLVAKVKATERAVEEDLPLLLRDPRAARQSNRCDFLWTRVLDPASALAARRYERDGEVVLQVDDPGGPAHGTFRLTVDQGRGHCERTSAPAELGLPVDVLGSTWLGGGDLSAHHRAGRVDARRPEPVVRLARMLRTSAPPWSSTWF